MDVPLIGITIGSAPSWKTGDADNYVEAVKQAGGSAALIEIGDFEAAERCDGIIFSGGPDVHPSLYPRHPAEEGLSYEQIIGRFELRVDGPRDGFELPLGRQLVQQDKPVLGICRGFQVLNIVLGGGLIPDIPLCMNGVKAHRAAGGKLSARHQVRLGEGSVLARLLGKSEVEVNSRHHQGVTEQELSPGVQATAWAPDGLVEAWELPGKAFFMGVQFHPERALDVEVREGFLPLFGAFVEAVRKSAADREPVVRA